MWNASNLILVISNQCRLLLHVVLCAFFLMSHYISKTTTVELHQSGCPSARHAYTAIFPVSLHSAELEQTANGDSVYWNRHLGRSDVTGLMKSDNAVWQMGTAVTGALQLSPVCYGAVRWMAYGPNDHCLALAIKTPRLGFHILAIV